MAGSISQTKVSQFASGLSQALNKIDANVATQVWAESLPILGNNLKDAADSGAAQLHYAANLGAAIKAGLNSLSGSASYTSAEVETAVNAALATAGFGGTGVKADFSQNGDLKLNFTTQDSGDSVNVATEQDLGLGNLGLKTSGTATTTLSEAFNFSAGIDATGFYVSTGSDANFTINTDTKLPGFTAAAELGGIGVQAVNPGSTDFTGNFDITLKDGDADGKLRLTELGGDLLDATLSGNANLDLNLKTTVPLDAVMPQVGTQLHVNWNFADSTVNPLDNNSDFGSTPTVEFRNSSINLGTFFNGMAAKVLTEINEITGPLMPIINFLTTPIPLLQDLGSNKVTLLDFMGLSPSQTSAIQGLADIANLAAKVASFGDAHNVNIDLGSVTLDGDIRTDLMDDLSTLVSRVPTAIGLQYGDLDQFLKLAGSVAGGGLAFPILQDIHSIGDMFLGKNIDLFKYNTSFGFDYEFKQFFPVMGPVGVTLGGLFGLSALFDMGFDTQGLKEYFDGGMADPSKIFDGFYVQATDDGGNTATGFRLSAGITAGVVATIGIAEVGVEGDITANIDFGLDSALDPLGTGKVRGLVLAATPIADLFDPSGSISAGLRAYLEVGFSPFSIEFSFDSPRVTLLDFDGDKADPILATLLGNGDLALNIGPRSAERQVGNLNDIAEKIVITQFENPAAPGTPVGLLLSGLRTTEIHDFPTRIVGDGGNSADDILMDAAIKVKAVFTGGTGRDTLTGGALADSLSGDEGADVLSGNGGIDTLSGGLGQDKLIGGAKGDTLDGGDGLDTASYISATAGMTINLQTMTFTGDGAGDVLISIERYEGTNFADIITGDNTSNSMLSGLDGNDTIRGLDGDDLLIGGKGDDDLGGGAGNDMLIGGEGADILAGGGGVDTVSYMTSKSPIIVNLQTGFGTGGDATGDVLSSIENLTGSALPFGDLGQRYVNGKPVTDGTGDTLIGSDDNNVISGLGGADYIEGGAGNDILYGDAKDASTSVQNANDFENDTLRGGLGNDKLFGQTGNDDMDGGDGQDMLDGGDGNDHLRTMDTASVDVLDGGTGVNRLSANYSDKTVSINWFLGQNNDFTFADGDTQRNFQNLGELDTGNKRDVIRLDGPLDDGYNNIIRTNGDNDVVYTGGGDDRIEGGGGNDKLYGGSEADYIDGGGGDDYVNGGSNNITLTFGFFGDINGYTVEKGGPDELHGGAGVDTVAFDELKQFVTYIGIGTDNGKKFGLGVGVDLATNTTWGAATGIKIDGFENIVGTDYGDDLRGDDQDNVFTPLRGGGLSSGATGGPDRIDGRGGTDTLVIDFSLADLPDAQGVYTNGTSISRNTIGNTATVDSYIYSNIENLRITGASKGDMLYSWTQIGNDVLMGLGGNDHLGGNSGSDTLLGGAGDDTISAQGAFDMGYNGAAGGRDVIDGGSGDDLIEDIAFGFSGPVLGADALFKLDGGTGFDTLSVDFSNQTSAIVWDSKIPTNLVFNDGAYAKNFEQLRYFASGSGNDVITQEGRVNNIFYLGAGDDVVNSGLGIDRVYGGDGNDLLILDFSKGDAANLAGVLGGGFGNEFFRTGVADNTRVDSVIYGGIDRMQITGSSKDDSFAGSTGDDKLYGGDGNDSVSGNNGGNDYIDGGAGNDTLTGSGGAYGPGANDTMLGGDGNDIIRSLVGDDKLYGGAGNDTLVADFSSALGAGSDLLSGGAGDDLISDISGNVPNTYAQLTDKIRLDGGTGNDTMSADFGLQTQAIVFTSGVSNSFTFSNGSYYKSFEQIGDLISGSGNDQVTLSGRFNNNFSTRDGDDTINLGLGIDRLYAGFGFDTLIVDYSKGDDANISGVYLDVNGLYTRRNLDTNAVVDSLYFNQVERILLTGGSKGDVLFGVDGDDVINGGAGDDTLRGGNGKDTLNGGSGIDTADFGDRFQAVVATLNGSTAVTVLVGGVVEDTIRNFENLTGGWNNDTLTGDALSNVLTGGTGNDLLDGAGGADVLAGGANNDTLKVDDAGDSVVEAVGGGFDTVLTTVTYTLAAGEEIEALAVLDAASTTAIRLTGNEFAQTITGNAGANVIDGGAGADTLSGLGGKDSFVFRSLVNGVDTIQDFVSGVDSIRISAVDFGGGLAAGGTAKLVSTVDIATFSGSGAARFIYDTDGADAGLYFDANGGSGSDAVLFAKLTGLPALSVSDIVLI